MNFEHVTLTVTFDLLLKNFIMSRNFLILRDKAFVLGICVPWDKAFQTVPKIFKMWPWLWPFTYFWILAILSYCKRMGVHIWHMCSLCPCLSNGTIDFKHVTLTVNFDLLLWKLNIAPADLHNAPRGPSWLCQYSSFKIFIIPPATKLGGVYWNHLVRLSVRPSVCPSVCPSAFGFPAHNWFPFTPIIMKLHMQTPHESRMCPIDFEVKRSKVKVTMHILLKMVSGA